jgi:hypothetical protein
MSTKKSRYVRMAYLLDADKLRQLVSLLGENVTSHIDVSESPLVNDKEIDYSVDFSDGTSRDFSSIEDVLNLPNSSKRRITSLSLSTPPFYSPIRARVGFRQDRSIAASYDLTGDDKEVLSLADKLDEYMLGVRQWYSPLTRFSFFWLLCFLYGVVFVLWNLTMGADYLFPNLLPIESSASSESSPGVQGVVVGAFLIIITVVWLLDWLFRATFPVSTFAIGQGIERHERLNKFRVIFLTSVLLPILVTLPFTYLP